MNHLIEYDAISRQVWHRLETAADDHAHPMHLMIMATVDEAGLPDARLLVLRGASRENRRLWFHSDCRSFKVSQLQRQPSVCIVGYDVRDDVQVRMYGSADLHHGDAIAEQHWEQTNMAIRTLYGSPHQPGMSLPEHDPRSHKLQAQMDTEQAEAGRYNFVAIGVNIKRIDWLQVSRATLRRATLLAETNWAVEPLAP